MTRDIKEDADEERRLNAKKSDGMDNVFLGNDRRGIRAISVINWCCANEIISLPSCGKERLFEACG